MGIFDCDCACAKPPDYSSTAAATEEAAKYAYKSAAEDLAFRKQVYRESRPHQATMNQLAQQVAQQFVNIVQASIRLDQPAAFVWWQHRSSFFDQ